MGQVAEDHSMLYSLISAWRKDDGQPLSDLHICAQVFTFVLAGQRHTHCFLSVLHSHLYCVSHFGKTPYAVQPFFSVQQGSNLLKHSLLQ